MTAQPTVHTDRLTLRPFTLDDVAQLRPLVGEKEIAATTMTIPHPYPDGEAERWIGTNQPRFEEGKAATFAVTLRESGELIGAIGLSIKREHSHAEMGYWIGKPYWNKEYATEATQALLRYGFDTLGLNRIFAHHMTKNPQSGRVMQKIGMTYEGTLPQHVRKGNGFEDLALYGITRNQYDARKTQSA
jgi:RimJ/RimL family protein N-acetyltransferase